MIKSSKRLSRVNRVFDPYQDRRDFVRLDRNEDPVGWDDSHFKEILSSLTQYDFAAYSDSTIFINKLSKWLDKPAEDFYITSGSDAAIKNIFESYVDENDKVIMQKPSWRMYDVYNDVYKGESVFINYNSELKWEPEKIIESLNTVKVKLIIIANPNQPTGTLTDKSILKDIIKLAEEKGTVVVIDEAYYMFTDETCLDLINEFSNLIIVRTFSKAFGLASLRLGYCVANPERIKELMLLRPVTDSNGLAIKIGEYAVDNIAWIHERLKSYILGREYLYNKLWESGLTTYKSATNFLLVKYPNIEIVKKVLWGTREKKYLLKGPFSFAPLENCLRITIGPEKVMRKFWDECSEVLIS
jgi:histidinol-phosphate aminotransferase